MERILVLTSYYLGKAATNGICTKNIVKELQQRGNYVVVLCYNTGEPGADEYVVDKKNNEYKVSLLDKGIDFIKSFYRPDVDEQLAESFARKALEICVEKDIDTIISIYFPHETVGALEYIKRKLPSIKTVIYELDSVGDGIGGGYWYQSLSVRAYNKWCRHYYQYADQIIIMQSHEDYWKKCFGKSFGDKVFISDIPVLIDKKIDYSIKKTDLTFVYAGALEKRYRSPSYLLKVFEKYAEEESATLNFFSKGDCEEIINQCAQRLKNIKTYGYVEEHVLERFIEEADVLVSIGNKVSRSVPSKLISYISYGKIIIHISSQKDDVCNYYIERYPLGLTLNEWDSPEVSAKKLANFLEVAKSREVDFENMVNVLQMNTPTYSVELMLRKNDAM